MVIVTFRDEGPLGISWRHRKEDGAAIVKLVREGAPGYGPLKSPPRGIFGKTTLNRTWTEINDAVSFGPGSVEGV